MRPVNARRPRLLQSCLSLFLLLASLLSGCVDADLGISFKGQTGGEIVQRIHLANQLTTFSGSTTQEWFDRLKHRARQLQGSAKQASKQDIEVTIPFDNGTDLAAKLNQLLSQFKATSSSSASIESPLIQSHLRVTQQNFLLLLRARLIYDLDLRSLGVQSSEGNLLLSPERLLNLKFSLHTPWGARSVNPPTADAVSTSPRQGLVWHLQPGEINHLEAVFWFPSPLGIGALAIALGVAGGMYLKYVPTPNRLLNR